MYCHSIMISRRTLLRAVVALIAFASVVSSDVRIVEEKDTNTGTSALLDLSTEQIDEKLQSCSFVQDLNSARLAAVPETSSLAKRIFSVLFPAGPAVNALLATAYISGPPNFLLALCPPDIDPNSLSVMVAFAVGGLLGDTLLHLLPQTFLGEAHDHNAHFVMLDPERNTVLGLFIFVGFATFLLMDKALRIASGGGDGHGHSHAHDTSAKAESVAGVSGVEVGPNGSVKRRKGNSKKSGTTNTIEKEKEINPSIKISSMLNLIADFSHNITDGLALSAAFYAGPFIGATTCLAITAHEIPHEVGDFALLIQSGFTKWQAMGAQFITAIGAFTGTLIGIAIQTYSASGPEKVAESGVGKTGILGTDLSGGDLVLPFTAGTFLYVGFSVIPELLETGPEKGKEITKTLKQGAAMALGFYIMYCISE